MNDLKKVKVTCCEGEGQGSCKRCVDKGIWNRMWMSFLYKIEGLEGCYCAKCVDEIMEEIETEIEVGELIDTVEYDYETFHLSMDCFWCQLIRGNLELLEAAEARWLTKETLKSVDWLPADSGLIEKIEKALALLPS